MAAVYTNYNLDNQSPFAAPQAATQQSAALVDLLGYEFQIPNNSLCENEGTNSFNDDNMTSMLSARPPTWGEQQQYDKDFAEREAKRILAEEDNRTQSTSASSTEMVVATSIRPMELTADQKDYAHQEAMRIIEEESRAMVPFNGRGNSNTTTAMTAYKPQSQHDTAGFSKTGVHPKKKKMKKQRKRRTAGGAVGGAIVGGVLGGPVGAIIGGATGAAVTNKACKTGEKRRQCRFEQQQFQKAADASPIHNGAAFA